MSDGLETIKTYLHHAALKQGLSEKTHVTGLADGANNCWSTLSVLEPHCQSLELILDWFHIGMKFETLKNALGKAFEESLEKAKWSLWHGKAEESLQKIVLIRDNISDEKKRSKLKGLEDYLSNNREYLVNYEKRKQENKPFTSQVAECHINTIINER
jgi:hypothetical protein